MTLTLLIPAVFLATFLVTFLLVAHTTSHCSDWMRFYRCPECGVGEIVRGCPCAACGADCETPLSVGRSTSYFAPWRKTRWEWRDPRPPSEAT